MTFKLGAYNRLFDHPFLFNNVAPLSQADFEGFKACNKNTAVMCEDISSIITLAVAEEEQESINILEQVGDQQAMSAFQAVQQLKIHRRIELIFGADSKEAIASHYVLAQKHLASGNTMMALDAAIKGLAYSEVLFGPFSEISLQGNVQLGEIHKRLGDIPRAIEYYRAFVSSPSLFHLISCACHLIVFHVTNTQSADNHPRTLQTTPAGGHIDCRHLLLHDAAHSTATVPRQQQPTGAAEGVVPLVQRHV